MCAPKTYFYNKKLLLLRRRTGRGMWLAAGGSWRSPSWSRGPAWPWTWPPSPSCATCPERSLVTGQNQYRRQCFESRLTESGSGSKHFADSWSDLGCCWIRIRIQTKDFTTKNNNFDQKNVIYCTVYLLKLLLRTFRLQKVPPAQHRTF
jgi:hypothetical protein